MRRKPAAVAVAPASKVLVCESVVDGYSSFMEVWLKLLGVTAVEMIQDSEFTVVSLKQTDYLTLLPNLRAGGPPGTFRMLLPDPEDEYQFGTFVPGSEFYFVKQSQERHPDRDLKLNAFSEDFSPQYLLVAPPGTKLAMVGAICLLKPVEGLDMLEETVWAMKDRVFDAKERVKRLEWEHYRGRSRAGIDLSPINAERINGIILVPEETMVMLKIMRLVVIARYRLRLDCPLVVLVNEDVAPFRQWVKKTELKNVHIVNSSDLGRKLQALNK